MRTGLVLALLAFAAPDSWACSPIAPMPSAAELVQAADVIVRAEAVRVERLPGAIHQPSWEGGFGRVTLAVKEVLKGSLPSTTITLNGYFEEFDEPNDRPVPYDFVRWGGRRGNCYALSYRSGADYLLMLKPIDRSVIPAGTALSPYWSALAPTNEQLFGPHDAWLEWVTGRLASARTNDK